MFHFTGFNTYKDDMQNELFVATNRLGEQNTQSSIPYTVYEEFFFKNLLLEQV